MGSPFALVRIGGRVLAGFDRWNGFGSWDDIVHLDYVCVKRQHTAVEAPALVTGAGTGAVRRYLQNTRFFNVMMNV